MNILRKKVKSYIAAVFAISVAITNTAPVFAASLGYKDGESAREKALAEYLSANNYTLVMNNSILGNFASDTKTATSADIVTYEEITKVESVAFGTVKRLNNSLAAGETVTVREGQPGKKTIVYKVKYINGVEVSSEIIDSYVSVAPVDKIIEYGNGETNTATVTDVSTLNYKYVIECTATAYDLSPEENGGYGGQTATGVPLDKGVIAVDPKVIPLGSRVYIEALDGSWSYGFAVAADTGGAIKGHKVDLCFRTRSECIQFGRRPCKVYIL